MADLLRRLENGERCWAAEIGLRAFGLALLLICASASLWLYDAVHRSAPPPQALEMADALVAFIGWSAGGAFLTVGPGLFRFIELEGRYARFSPTQGANR